MEREETHIGIDVSQDTLDMAAYPTGQIWQYKNNKSGIAKVVAKLAAISPKLVVMEATGGLEQALKNALDEAELAVAVVIGNAAKDLVNSIAANLIMPLVGMVTPGGNWRELWQTSTRLRRGGSWFRLPGACGRMPRPLRPDSGRGRRCILRVRQSASPASGRKYSCRA